MSRFVLVHDVRGWDYSPMTHINQRGPAFLHPKVWPAWVWKECACK